MTYLKNDELRDLVILLEELDLIHPVRTSPLFSTLPNGLRNAMRTVPSPMDENFMALTSLNRIERLADGEVPMIEVLQNAILSRRDRSEVQKLRALKLRLDQIASGAAEIDASTRSAVRSIVLEAIVFRDDMLPFSFLWRALEVGLSVARLSVPMVEQGVVRRDVDGQPYLFLGTGWLIGSDLMITNHHVLNARSRGAGQASERDLQEQTANTRVEFDVERAVASPPVAAGPHRLVAHDAGLDYAIFRLGGVPPDADRLGERRPRRPLSLAPEPLLRDVKGDINEVQPVPVNIIQHPRGGHKQVALRNNLVVRGDRHELLYLTDTDVGSSGSPVCDDSWQVVGLHRAAESAGAVQYMGKTAAVANAGVPMVAILDDLERRHPELHSEIRPRQATPSGGLGDKM